MIKNTVSVSFILLVCAVTTACLLANKAQAAEWGNWQISGAWGKGLSRYELNFAENTRMRPEAFRFSIAQADILSWQLSSNTSLYLDLDASVFHLNDPRRKRHITALSLVPMWRIEYPFETFTPFLRLGIGVAVLDSTEWMDRKMGSHLHFEDRIELGIRIAKHQVAKGISHFSNANLADINHGANVYYIGYAYRW